jgi:hypothetical protein
MTLSPRQKQRAKQIAARQRLRPNTMTDFDIPVRDTNDAYGNPFLGLPGNRLRVNAVSNAELYLLEPRSVGLYQHRRTRLHRQEVS